MVWLGEAELKATLVEMRATSGESATPSPMVATGGVLADIHIRVRQPVDPNPSSYLLRDSVLTERKFGRGPVFSNRGGVVVRAKPKQEMTKDALKNSLAGKLLGAIKDQLVPDAGDPQDLGEAVKSLPEVVEAVAPKGIRSPQGVLLVVGAGATAVVVYQEAQKTSNPGWRKTLCGGLVLLVALIAVVIFKR